MHDYYFRSRHQQAELDARPLDEFQQELRRREERERQDYLQWLNIKLPAEASQDGH